MSHETQRTDVADQMVSVVVPLFNARETLDQCLESVLAQTHANLEVICLNDGSTDGTLDALRAHERRDARVRVVDKPNQGYGATCNRGIDEARGTWLAIVEPDDYLEPTALADLLARADELGGPDAVDVVRAPYWRAFDDEDGREVRAICPYAGRVRPASQPFWVGDADELLRHHPSVWAGAYRLGYLRERGIRFVEAPGAGWTDNPFMAQTLLLTRRVAYVDRPGYVYRERDLNEADSFAARQPLVPLTRWNEMMDVAERAGVDDRRVLGALALRGVNYALITCGAAEGEPGVWELVQRSMRRLPQGLVLSERSISPAGKALHARACGLPDPRASRLAYWAHLAGEAVWRVRANGLGFTLRTALSRRGGRLG